MKSYAHEKDPVAPIKASGGKDNGQGNGGGSNSDLLAQQEREVYLRAAQDVVTESNDLAKEGEDDVWLAFNGTNQGVDKDDPNKDKPAEWYRGIEVDHDVLKNPSGASAKASGLKDMQTFREQIQHDLNFNDVFTKFGDDGEAFVSAIVTKYGGNEAERKERIEWVGRNLWAYATTGADVTGNTDVGELQGMLFYLDPMIAEASQSNTDHEGSFTLPGTDIEMHTHGDDVYGRASMLECRLLSAILGETIETPEEVPEEIPEPILETVSEEIPGKIPEDDDDFSKSIILTDTSSSMDDDWKMFQQYVDQVNLGNVKFGGYTSHFKGIEWDQHGDMDDEAMENLVAKLKHSNSSTERKGLSNAFKKTGGAEESSIQMAIDLLESMDPAEIDQVKGEQIVVISDEWDTLPNQLTTLHELANRLGVLVKIVHFNKTEDTMYEISVNHLSQETLDLIEQVVDDIDSKQANGKASTEMYRVNKGTKGTVAADSGNVFTSQGGPDQATSTSKKTLMMRQSNDDIGTKEQTTYDYAKSLDANDPRGWSQREDKDTHYALNWEAVAELEGIKPLKRGEKRTPRGTPQG